MTTIDLDRSETAYRRLQVSVRLLQLLSTLTLVLASEFLLGGLIVYILVEVDFLPFLVHTIFSVPSSWIVAFVQFEFAAIFAGPIIFIVASMGVLELDILSGYVLGALALISYGMLAYPFYVWVWPLLALSIWITPLVAALSALTIIFVVAFLRGIGVVVWASTADRAILRPIGLRSFGVQVLELLGIPLITQYLNQGRFFTRVLFFVASLFLGLGISPVVTSLWVVKSVFSDISTDCRAGSFGGRQQCIDATVLAYYWMIPAAWGAWCLLFYALSVGCSHWARGRVRLSAQDLSKVDRRDPIFFLRPFVDDQIFLPPRRIGFIGRFLDLGRAQRNLDELLIIEATALGPVVALGNPQDRFPPYGAARGYFDGKSWQQAVKDLAEKARAIVLCIEDSPGIWWEIEHLATDFHLAKTLFVLPPRLRVGGDRDNILERLFSLFREHALPPPDEAPRTTHTIGLLMEGTQLVTYDATKPSVDSYRLMLREFIDRRVSASETVRNPVPVRSRRYSYTYGGLAALFLGVIFSAYLTARPEEGDTFANLIGNEWLSSGPGRHQSSITGLVRLESNRFAALAKDSFSNPSVMWMTGDGNIQRTFDLTKLDPGRSQVALAAGPNSSITGAFGGSNAVEVFRLSVGGDDVWHGRIALPGLGSTAVQDVKVLRDGGTVLAGRLVDARELMVLRLGRDGALLWQFVLGGTRAQWANRITPTIDGGFAIACWLGERPNGELGVIKLTADGKQLWRQSVAETDRGESGQAIVEASNGDLIVAGEASSSKFEQFQTVPALLKVSKTGEILWHKVYSSVSYAYVTSVILHQAGIVVAGHTGAFDQEPRLLVTDLDGRLLKNLTPSSSNRRGIYAMVSLGDNGLLVGGEERTLGVHTGPLDSQNIPSHPWLAHIPPERL
jgi:outer membrane protein assembly factor BamB